jgi:hypothetical protein
MTFDTMWRPLPLLTTALKATILRASVLPTQWAGNGPS